MNFVEINGANSMKIRTYERGVEAETMACGTGSIAAAVYGVLMKGLGLPVRVMPKSGQEIAVDVDEQAAVTMALEPGEMSLHNVRLAHASGPNSSGDRRIGVSFHYMPTRSRQMVGSWDSAALVRGEDRFHHFATAPVPSRDMDPVAVAFHERASTAVREILFEGAARVRPTL